MSEAKLLSANDNSLVYGVTQLRQLISIGLFQSCGRTQSGDFLRHGVGYIGFGATRRVVGQQTYIIHAYQQ